MSRNIYLTLTMITVALLTAGLAALYDMYRTPPGERVTIAAPKTVPDFGVTTTTGQIIHIADLRGKVVILNFWATWCAPCVVEFPTLIALTHQYKGDVVLLALSSDRDRDTVQKFIKDQRAKAGATFNPARILVAMDDNRALTRDLFKITTYPESLIIAPDGTIARHIIGTDAWADPETTALIEKLIPAKDASVGKIEKPH